MFRTRLAVSVGIATALVAASLVLGASSATAATAGRGSGELTFAYHSTAYLLQYGATGPDGFGSETGFYYTQQNLQGYTFLSLGSGRGQAVKNNAAHVFNDGGSDARVYYNSYTAQGCWCGSYDPVWSASDRDLGITKNNNAAFVWLASPGVPV